MAFVYILECKNGTLYTGSTKDLKNRMKQHTGLIKNGRAKYTKANPPVRLLAVWQTDSFSHACKLESAIKKLPRNAKLLLIENPSYKHIQELFPKLCEIPYEPIENISLEDLIIQ